MSDGPLKVIAGAPDHPLVIGSIKIPCYVLEDETRVLTQSGIFLGIGASRGSPKIDRGAQIPRFLASKAIFPFVSNELIAVLKSPVLFQPPEGGRTAYGYPATILADVCEAILEARHAGVLRPQQIPIAENCRVLSRALMRTAIIALVDEATGYQRIREERALATILEKFIAKELQPWTRTFPYEFYDQIFRLKRWPGPDGVKRPSMIGHYTNDFVYARIAPQVLEELRRINPTLAPGQRRHRRHQWFTPELGHPRLREHIAGVVALMRAASRWDAFLRSLRRAFPKNERRGSLTPRRITSYTPPSKRSIRPVLQTFSDNPLCRAAC